MCKTTNLSPAGAQSTPLEAASAEQLKKYISSMLELKRKNNPFPVKLDDVWKLCYSSKASAVRALKRDYVEGKDYIMDKDDAPSSAGRHEDKYHLSFHCFEYFIVLDNRAMFEAYTSFAHPYIEEYLKH